MAEKLQVPQSMLSTSANSSPDILLSAVAKSFVRILADLGFSASQIREALEGGIEIEQFKATLGRTVSLGHHQRDCMEVMCLWRRDIRFLGPDGLARPLIISGSANSFEDLYGLVSSRGEYRRALELLVQFGAVQLLPGNRVEALTPTFVVAGAGSPVAVDTVMKILAGFLNVIEHNVLGREDASVPRFERSCTVVLPEEARPVAERLIAERGQFFIDSVDEHLMRLAQLPSRSGRMLEIGAGAYCVNLGNV